MRLKEFLQQGGLIGDPNKIQSIINRYGNGKSPFKASDYIEVSNSTGVPIELLLAQGIAESSFGTAGRAVITKNVGNVGNTDSGAAEYRDSWKDGLYRQANLLKKEYKVNDTSDVQRLIANNFKRPSGGNYASAPDYGVKVGKLINSISNYKFDVNAPSSSNVTGDFTVEARQPTMPNEMFANLNDWNNFQQFAKKNPSILGVLTPDLQKQFEETARLENERLKQEQVKSQVEAENERIQLALQEKQQQRAQILSMIPQSQSITYGDIKPSMMQKGGKIDTKKYEISDIRAFYGDMLSSQWYKDRIKNNGYERQWTDSRTMKQSYDPSKMTKDDVASDIVSNRMQPLVQAKFEGESTKYDSGYSSLFETINMNPDELRQIKVSPRTVLAHEVSHATRNADYAGAPLSVFEHNFIRQRAEPDADLDPKVDTHILDPEEAKSDLDSIRYNLYKQGKFDPKTGKYKTKSGKFEDSLLNSLKDDNSVKRMQRVYKGKGITEMMNTLAINDNEDNDSILYAKLGGIIK
jgi:hypothetical protein